MDKYLSPHMHETTLDSVCLTDKLRSTHPLLSEHFTLVALGCRRKKYSRLFKSSLLKDVHLKLTLVNLGAFKEYPSRS